MTNQAVYDMPFAKVYPLLVNKAVRKGRTPAEVDAVITWLTGYTAEQIARSNADGTTYGDFFRNAPALHPNRELIRGTICGVKIEAIQDPLMQDIRRLDKLVDELAKGRPLDKICRQG